MGRSTEAMRRLRAGRRDRGLCPECGEVLTPSSMEPGRRTTRTPSWRCAKCRARHALAARELYKVRIGRVLESEKERRAEERKKERRRKRSNMLARRNRAVRKNEAWQEEREREREERARRIMEGKRAAAAAREQARERKEPVAGGVFGIMDRDREWGEAVLPDDG